MAMLATGILLLSVALGLSYHLVLPRSKTAWRALWKVLPIVFLSVYATVQGSHPLLVLALVFAAFGDGFLAFEGERAFLRGVAAFLLCHLTYIALLVLNGGRHPWEGWTLAVVLTALAATVVVIARIRVSAGWLIGPMLAYTLVILTMLVLATRTDARVLAGACLFVVSDLILVVRRFWTGPEHRHDGVAAHAVWATYFFAQIMLTLGFAAA